MATATPKQFTPGCIEPDVLYTMAEFQARSNLGSCGMRTARRKGLRVRYLNGRAYILGRDFIEYTERESAEG